MSPAEPNATPECQCWDVATAEDREAKVLRHFLAIAVSSAEVTAGL